MAIQQRQDPRAEGFRISIKILDFYTAGDILNSMVIHDTKSDGALAVVRKSWSGDHSALFGRWLFGARLCPSQSRRRTATPSDAGILHGPSFRTI